LRAKTTKEADSVVRDVCGGVWQKEANAEKAALYNYTSGSGKFNRPLSGYKKPYHESGSGWEKKYFKGSGKVWIDYEGAGDKIRVATDMISRSSCDFDMRLRRGSGFSALESRLALGGAACQK
jgi:hypothetical protein